MLRPLILAFGLMPLPSALFAHPHIFVDAGLTVLFDAAGQATAVRIAWRYDDFTTLTILGELGLDRDLDGRLTAEEAAGLAGFDMNWEPGFLGDTHALVGAQPLALGPPVDPAADYSGGRLTSWHTRMFPSPLAIGAEPLIIQAYDPGYYTHYVVETADLQQAPAGCRVQIYTPDLTQAEQELKDALAELNPGEDAEAFFPAVGAAFAEEARVQCDGG